MPVLREGKPGEFPETVKGTQQYGANLKAYIVLLAAYGMVGVRRIKALLGLFFGVWISEGSITRAVGEWGEGLSGPVEALNDHRLKAVGGLADFEGKFYPFFPSLKF
jgi:hypothetical protein